MSLYQALMEKGASLLYGSGESDDFDKKLRLPWSRRNASILYSATSLFGLWEPSSRYANSRRDIIWLLDNTAYQPITPNSRQHRSWQVEAIACIFERNDSCEVGRFVSMVADLIGLDGEMGHDQEVRRRIQHRLQPFLDHVVSKRLITLEIPLPNNLRPQAHDIGPSNDGGVISQVVSIGPHFIEDGTMVQPYLHGDPRVSMTTTFSAPEGWMIISDIDDTIKRTKTSERMGILQTTFAEEPQPIPGMPELYSHIHNELIPTWFYVSASPYNLYPFLHEFIHTHYSHGTMLLRDFSWRNLGSLLRSFTEDTQEYKVEQIEKIHKWFPRRRAVCVGDSTQSDPETYAEIYKKHPDWVQAILIRKVTDIRNMEEKNAPKRFEDAFKDIPGHVCKVFENPDELYELLDGLGTRDTAYL